MVFLFRGKIFGRIDVIKLLPPVNLSVVVRDDRDADSDEKADDDGPEDKKLLFHPFIANQYRASSAVCVLPTPPLKLKTAIVSAIY